MRDLQRIRCCPYIPESEWLPDNDGPPGPGLLNQHMGTMDRNLLVDVDEDGRRTLRFAFCPGAFARSEAAAATERAWRWWKEGQLREVYPDGVPAVVLEAVEYGDRVAHTWRAEGARLKREEKRKKR